MTANDQAGAGQSDLATISEAAARLGKSERTIRRMIKAGKLNTVDIGGQTCIQMGGISAQDKVTGTGVQMTAPAGQTDRHMFTAEAEALRDIVRRQDSEISYLRGELTAIRSTLETVTRMLPPPKSTENARLWSGAPAWIWVLVATIVLAAGVGGYWLWLTR